MMSLLLAISGGVAFLVAFGLLKAGVVSMAVRYGVAAVVGYALLLGMFRLWLWAAIRRMAGGNRKSDSTVTDVILDGVSDAFFPEPRSGHGIFDGGGGFGGGGGGTSWEGGNPTGIGHGVSASSHATQVSSPGHASSPAHHSSGTATGGDGRLDIGIDLDLDLDDGWIIVIPIIAAVAIGAVVIGVVWAAPTLFAELLLDALVGAGIYRGLRRWERSYWLESAVRRTRWAAAAVIVIAIAAGYLIQRFAPDTVSIGDLWR
jgi:hypothetical protein